jgi:hypothetical protein
MKTSQSDDLGQPTPVDAALSFIPPLQVEQVAAEMPAKLLFMLRPSAV